MAKQVVETLVDDLDGGVATESVEFAIDRRHFVLDLSYDNAEEFRRTLSRYVAAATPIVGPPLAPGRTRSRLSAGANGKAKRGQYNGRNYDTIMVRRWAQSVGIEIGDRGRFPSSVLDQYFLAHPDIVEG